MLIGKVIAELAAKAYALRQERTFTLVGLLASALGCCLVSATAPAQDSCLVVTSGGWDTNVYWRGQVATFEEGAEATWAILQGNLSSPPGCLSDGKGGCLTVVRSGACEPYSGYPNSAEPFWWGTSCPLEALNYGVIDGMVIQAEQLPGCGFFIAVNVPMGQTSTPDQVGDPVNPALGNVYKIEVDGSFKGASNLSFQRFYNSNDLIGTDMGPSWRHSFDRAVAAIYQPPPGFYPPPPAIVSPQYPLAASACTSGFAAIQSQVPGWQAATATYQGGVCAISTSAGQIDTVPVLSVFAPAPGPTQPTEYDLIRDDGQTLRYPVINGAVTNPPGISIRLAITGSGYTVTDDQDNVESYSTAGILQSITSRAGVVQTMAYSNGLLSGVTDSFGSTLSIGRNAASQIGSVAFGSAGTVQYGYDGNGRLATVTNLDLTTLTYTYGNSSFPNALTVEHDENASQYVSWTYDSQERANSATLADGALATSISYPTSSSTQVTDGLGAVRMFSFTRVGDINKAIAISGSQCASCEDSAATTYDANGWVSNRTDYNGNLTCYANDPVRGLELVRVEGFAPGSTCPSDLATYTPASGTLQRKITTVWSSTWREPSLITEPNRTTGFTFDDSGNVLTKTITDLTVTPNATRVWTYTYNGFGQVLTAKLPRTDLNSTTTYTYWTCTTGTQCGQVETIKNALGQVTTFNTYNAYGQPLTITDPNGVVSTLTYDARERLKSLQVGTGLAAAETTGYSYYPTGLLDTVTLPDSTVMTYGYDGAHRLTDITDTLGNHLHYTLDALGNHTADQVYDPTNTLRRAHTRVFNTLSELYQDVNAADTAAVTTTFGYDAQGNLTSIAAPLARNTADYYDALNRLTQTTDPNGGKTYLGYDANDNLASVQDPRALTTSYTHDGYGDLTKVVSPDTGTTTKTYDSGGNLKTSTDSRGAEVTFTLDALNRITQQAYADQTIAFKYDTGTYGKGRLTSASDSNHSLSWTYDALGRVIGKGQVVGGVTRSVGYSYSNGDLVTLVTPSGQKVTYGYTNHQVTSIAINGTTLLSGVTYFPYGPVSSWTWGNGTAVARTYDEDGKIVSITTAGDTVNFGYDNAFRITSVSDTGKAAYSWVLPTYDLLDRLEAASSGTGASYGWTYDANGNRLTQTGTNAATFKPATQSNQLASTSGALVRTYAYDAAGNTQSYGTSGFTFNDRGRMSAATVAGTSASYVYSALGQLIEKNVAGSETVLTYDESGHLLGEYTSSGALVQETVWMGDIPVATLRRNGTPACTTTTVCIFYVHTDQLNAPRKISQPSSNTLAWRWDADPFGTVAAAQDPAGLGAFVYNLRLPGQYYQAETALNYNYFRDYDPQTGRYLESDPLLGLTSAVTGKPELIVPALLRWPKWLTPYAYVTDQPISEADPYGLGPLSIIKCLWYSKKFTDAATKCKGQCPNDMEGQARFIEQNATNGSLDTAMLNCTCKQLGNEMCAKWLESCMSVAITAPYKPR
jgi:RHS repeat-associated protein